MLQLCKIFENEKSSVRIKRRGILFFQGNPEFSTACQFGSAKKVRSDCVVQESWKDCDVPADAACGRIVWNLPQADEVL